MPLDLGTTRGRLQPPVLLGQAFRLYGVARMGTALRLRVILCLAVLALLGAMPAVYLALTDIGLYNSPDETSRYLAARAYAETGRLALSDPVSVLELSGSSGPRGFVRNGKEITTIYPLGHPALVGLVYRAFGDTAILVLSLVPAALMAFLGAVLWRLQPMASPIALLIIPSALPIWFWASFAHLDVGLAWGFAAAGLLGWVQALRGRNLGWVVLGSSGFAVAALVRHQEAPFLLLLALTFIAGMCWQQRNVVRAIVTLALYALPQVAFFLWPMAQLNAATYGDALTFGNTLFYRELFPERLPEQGGAVSDALGFLSLAFFPQPVSGGTMVKGLWFQIFLLSPPLVILGLYGAWTARTRLLGTLGPVGVAGLCLSLAYVILSRSDPGVVGAGAMAPDLSSSLTRYYWPIYIALVFGAGVALAAMRKDLARALVAGLLALSGYTMWLSPEDSIPAWQNVVIAQHDRLVPKVEAKTEPNAVIYTGNIDKWLVGSRRVISFWQDGGATYQARSMMDHRRVAADAATILDAGMPVYFLFRPANGEDVTALEAPLAGKGLGVVWVDRFARGLDLWRVERLEDGGTVHRLSPTTVAISGLGMTAARIPVIERREGFLGDWRPVEVDDHGSGFAIVTDPLVTQPVFYRVAESDARPESPALPLIGPLSPMQLSPVEEGWSSATLVAEEQSLNLWISSDGASANLVRNPSFETDLVGWRGADPGEAGKVERTSAQSSKGDAALRMELAASPEGTRIARTLRVDALYLGSAILSLRADAFVAEARDVRIEMRLIAKDMAGNDTFYASAQAQDTEAAGFGPLVIEGARLPAETASVEIQLTVIARKDAAKAVVFWDGIELRPHDRLPHDYLDGDAPSSAWTGAPHRSPSTIAGGIEAIRVTHRSGDFATLPQTVTLAVRAQRGDLVEITDGHLTLKAMTGEVLGTMAMPSFEPGDQFEIALKASGTPAVARIVTAGDFK